MQIEENRFFEFADGCIEPKENSSLELFFFVRGKMNLAGKVEDTWRISTKGIGAFSGGARGHIVRYLYRFA